MNIDKEHIWHPYSAIGSDLPVYPVRSANGTRIQLQDGRELIDGMSSWWCAIHGYNVPELNAAITDQLDDMAHIMFGGLTHQPATELTEELIKLTPEGLDKVFFCDSGSVSVEVAMKMAIQYWHATGQTEKQRFLTILGGYHGDTFAAMSVCDPVTGMHSLFEGTLQEQFFVDRPDCRFGESCSDDDIAVMRETLSKHRDQIAAVILEPIVQGAGGMWFYSADYLKRVRQLCDEFDVLLIADEIATGFGRTGRLFACEHAEIVPDILCIGKSLTGGYMTLAATITNEAISSTISEAEPHVFMHGPTFMANPLACRVAAASIRKLIGSDWRSNIERIESALDSGLASCRNLPDVADVRVLGAIGVVEMQEPVDLRTIQPAFVERSVWIRPFGRLIYIMPAFVINDEDISTLTNAVRDVIENL